MCLSCARIDLKTYPTHAKVGLGRCALDNLPGVFVSFFCRRECSHFLDAAPDIKEKRIEWSEKL